MGDLDAKITESVRRADEAFEKVGGSSRHWVRECLLPSLESDGISIVTTAELLYLREKKDDCDAFTEERTEARAEAFRAQERVRELERLVDKLRLVADEAERDRISTKLMRNDMRAERDEALDELRKLREENEWIPVTERLPEPWERVLLIWRTIDAPAYSVGCVNSHSDGWEGPLGRIPNVIAWRPLPKPPEVK